MNGISGFAGIETVADAGFGFDQTRLGGALQSQQPLRAVYLRDQKVMMASTAAVNIVSSLESLNGRVSLKE